ncbi:hypothetical protein K435DRAFT_935536 [Dendrothele bispora CBS 962.96]|uniref:Uncharacterized protein n=1 Tax=Dendrothele bispora (strain CBS 962.96) TaxID=1314807 RepID=A0A4S8L072_DENBC|nr:hypothetical protein K435DRAFT_935536 [Dendrothele bispora CBS 962.96]
MDCHLGAMILEVFFFLLIGSTTGLFALRVQAVYEGHRLGAAYWCFSLWTLQTTLKGCANRDAARPVAMFFIPSFTKTSDMSPLLKSLIQDGQLYYLISLFWEILVIVLLLVPAIGPYYRCFMLSAHLVIVNSTACHVFRNVRLGRFQEEAITSRPSNSTQFTSYMVSIDVGQDPRTVEFADPVDGDSPGVTELNVQPGVHDVSNKNVEDGCKVV